MTLCKSQIGAAITQYCKLSSTIKFIRHHILYSHAKVFFYLKKKKIFKVSLRRVSFTVLSGSCWRIRYRCCDSTALAWAVEVLLGALKNVGTLGNFSACSLKKPVFGWSLPVPSYPKTIDISIGATELQPSCV